MINTLVWAVLILRPENPHMGAGWSPEPSRGDVSRAQGAQGHYKLFATQAERSQRSLEAAGAFRRLFIVWAVLILRPENPHMGAGWSPEPSRGDVSRAQGAQGHYN